MLILHIGSPKTGTTSLQQFLYTNEDRLREGGINYMRAARSHIAHNPLPIAVTQQEDEALLRAILDEYERSPDQTHVISSEIMFRVVVARRLHASFPKDLRDRTRIICYLRRQDHYVEAIYKQRAKNGLVTVDRQAFLKAQMPKLSYSAALDSYADLVGAERMTIRPFERRNFKGGDVVQDFADSMLGLHDLEGFELPPARSNPSLSVELTEMLGRIAHDRLANVRELIRELGQMDDPDLISSRDTYSIADRLAVMRHVAEDNEKLRRRYLPDTGRLFDLSDLEDAAEAPALAPEAIARRAHAGALALARAMQSQHRTALEAAEARTAATPAPEPVAPSPPPPEPAAPEAPDYPIWFNEITPAGTRQGFFRWLGNHGAAFVQRSDAQLVVTFDNLHNVGDSRPGRDPWAAKFCAERDYSHLGVISQASDWFRDAALIDFFAKLARDGFFDQFDRVCFAGTSMGGFGALSFAALVPDCNVVAFSPQSTLNTDLVPWEKRFANGRAADWTLPLSDGAETIAPVARAYLIFDPFFEPDRLHAMRIQGPGVIHLKAFGFGHKTALVMNRMGLLKQVMEHAIDGTLTEGEFYRLIRARKDIFLYREAIASALIKRGQDARAQRFRDAFKRRRRSR